MFSRPYRHVPLFPKTPAGFRMFNSPGPKPCFRPSIFSRNLAPNLGTNPAPPLFDYNAPPTHGLSHIFGPTPTPKNVTPRPKVYKKTPSLITPRRKHGHKRFTYHLTVTRPGLRRKGPHFRSPAKIKRENAVVALNKLEDVASETMQTGRMTREDHIFLKQLEELRLDQHRKHQLGDARATIERAEELAPRRAMEHEERDRLAAVRVEHNVWRKQEREELRRLEELRREEEERRRQEEEKRRQEEQKRREEERARLREQRDRELRAKQEAFRKAQEEAERRAREQAARRIREEAQRQERVRQEELHRKAAQEGLVACFQVYDAKWEELKKSKTLTSVMLCEMPWPIFVQGCSSPDDISQRSMEEFIFHPHRVGMENKSRKDRLKIEMLRFHPDKFNSHIVSKLRECDREMAIEIAGAVARILTGMMAQEIQRGRDGR
ncbi:hypothetical protein K503DRAFT_614425 [Rhizopogon vinicolor AM-OR11-026]|uniref:Uncharacterized protein n=1 Tax=Rhizopogon vinicolor AM-OR11-026 TaxID=1314800 RepID=A0A1B7N6I1_9AGAM|nr:hypothetical protein K503DRAFT_614425 [Rhizopogon vinicolor AM-OR11-026]